MKRFLAALAVAGLASTTLLAQEGPGAEYRKSVAVDPALPSYVPRALSPPEAGGFLLPGGEIQILGNDGDRKLMQLWTAAFAKHHPQIRFKLNLAGSSVGIAGLYTGVSLFAPMGREIWPVEVTPFEKMLGYKPFEIRTSRGSYDVEGRSGAIAVYVHRDNPVEKLTMDQLAAIFSAGVERPGITYWGQLGLKGEWAYRRIHLYGTLGEGGRARFFAQRVLAGAPPASDIEGERKRGDTVQRVKEDVGGIGITGFGHPGAKRVALAESDAGPYSNGSLADVAAGKYPLSRFTYIYARRPPGAPLDPVTKEFLRFVLSKQGQELVVKEGVLLPLSADIARAELAKLD